MSPLLTTRRAPWWPGLAVLGAAVVIAAAFGLWLGPRSWPFELGVVAGLLFFLWLGGRARRRRAGASAAPRHRKTKTVPPRGPADYDLARDDSTDGQRWLM